MNECEKNPRISKIVIGCYASTDFTPINNLLILFGILYLIGGIFGLLYTILKEVSFSDLFLGVYSIGDIIQQISTGRICDDQILDAWSLCHFIGHSFLVIFFYRFLRNQSYAFVLSTLVSIIWEITERIIVLYVYNFACESWGNSISDILLGIVGSLLSIYFLNIDWKDNKKI